MASEQEGFLHPLQQMNRQNAILEHTVEILKQELNEKAEEVAQYRSALRGYEGAHTRIEQLEQQLAQAQAAVNSTLDQMTEMEADQAAMRALLAEVGDWKLTISVHDAARYNDLVARVRAYLAAHPAPAPLEAEDNDE